MPENAGRIAQFHTGSGPLVRCERHEGFAHRQILTGPLLIGGFQARSQAVQPVVLFPQRRLALAHFLLQPGDDLTLLPAQAWIDRGVRRFAGER